jgi:RNA polymerase primary sigma factor
MGKDIPFIDLIQDGNLGLMKAIEKFDHTKGFRFSTYATRLIRQAITRAIDNTARTIRVPVSMHEQVRRLSWAIRQFKQEWGRNPSIEEISQFTGQNFKGVELILRAATIPLSLNEPVGEDDDTELGDFIEDKSALEPSDIVAKRMMREEIEKHLETLNHREARILRLRFGLDGGPALTLEQVGQKFSLTRERIRQIEDKALRRLRHPRRSRKLRAYYES